MAKSGLQQGQVDVERLSVFWMSSLPYLGCHCFRVLDVIPEGNLRLFLLFPVSTLC
jgi:hypothetical protein